jgi:hypothetical protein
MQMRKSVTMMKAFASALFVWGTYSCSTVQVSECGERASKLDSVTYYIYQEKYDECSTSVLELSYKDGQVTTGYFWGTSDEFTGTREGYYPGFFVLPMENIQHHGDGFSFVLDSRKTQFLSGPVKVTFRSTADALKQGAHLWMQEAKFFQDSVAYQASFSKEGLIIHKHKSKYDYYEDHSFKRISLDALKKKSSECSYEKENRKLW